MDKSAYTAVYRSVLNLSWHYPILIPYLDLLLEQTCIPDEEIKAHLNKLILENCKYRRSDGICWPLHIMKKRSIPVDNDIIDAVIESEDCVGITILNSVILFNDPIVQFAQTIINSDDNYKKDSYWLLLYQLFKNKVIDNPYKDNVFQVLLDNNVDFLPEDGVKTEAEKICEDLRLRSVFGNFEAAELFLSSNESKSMDKSI